MVHGQVEPQGAEFMVALAAAVVIAIFGAWTTVGYVSTKGIETPKYTVVSEHSGYEVREYAPYIRAEVTREGDFRETMYGGFEEVGGYIFGANTRQSKIAMTAPVLHEAEGQKIAMTAPVLHEAQAGTGKYTLAFVMPSAYRIEDLPTPNNPNVKLREVPRQRYAVLSFGGYATERRTEKKMQKLLEELKKDGRVPAGSPILAQYDPPWTPLWMRHNEIQVPLQE
jgi:hypothetical protein